MPIIRVGVQAVFNSAGQVVDFDGGSVSTSLSLTNASAESIAYSTSGGTSWTTLASGASASVGVVEQSQFRLRKVSGGAYPVPVDVDVVASDGLTGSESVTVRALVSAAGISGPGEKLALFGDSITAQNFSGTNYAQSWALLGSADKGWPWREMLNHGVSSETTAQMLSRLGDVLASGATVVSVLGGTNDLTSADLVAASPTGAQFTKEMIVSNLKSIVDQCLANGQRVILHTVPPGTGWTATTTQAGILREAANYVNAWVRRYAREVRGVALCDSAAAIAEPTTGGPRTNYLIDTVHPSNLGRQQMARAFSQALGDLGVKRADTLSETPLDPLNLCGPTGMILGSASTGTSGVSLTTVSGVGPFGCAASVRNTGAAVGSLQAPTDEKGGNYFRLAMTSSAAYDGALVLVGGDVTTAIGRWDQAWAATTAYTYGARKYMANGYSLVCVVPGTTGGSSPSSTQEGELIVDGTVTWLVQRPPMAGEQVYAELEFRTGTITAGAGLMMTMFFRDSTGAQDATTYGPLFELGGTYGVPGTWLPSSGRLRTPLFTIPSNVNDSLAAPTRRVRYLYATANIYGAASGACALDIRRVTIRNASREV